MVAKMCRTKLQFPLRNHPTLNTNLFTAASCLPKKNPVHRLIHNHCFITMEKFGNPFYSEFLEILSGIPTDICGIIFGFIYSEHPVKRLLQPVLEVINHCCVHERDFTMFAPLLRPTQFNTIDEHSASHHRAYRFNYPSPAQKNAAIKRSSNVFFTICAGCSYLSGTPHPNADQMGQLLMYNNFRNSEFVSDANP